MDNRTFRLFVSSTFEDFGSERKILNSDINEELVSFCESYGYHFEIVDLRWGIRSEAAVNQKTIPICINEVQKCLSGPSPNFLIMIGDRYGWIPLPYILPSKIYNKLDNGLAGEERELFREWYLLDRNSIDFHYVLKPRKEKYTDEKIWKQLEDKLREILQRASKTVLTISEAKKYFFTSATEQEIEEGLLVRSQKEIEKSIIWFRNEEIEKDEKVEECRKRIEDKMKSCKLSENIFEVSKDKEYLDTFREKIIERLKEFIGEEIKRLDKIKKESTKRDISDGFARQYTENFWGREEELDNLQAYIENEEQKLVFVFGDSGSGKTALLSKLYLKNRKDEKKYCVARFWGIEGSEPTLLSTLQSCLEELQEKFGIQEKQSLRYHDAKVGFWKALEKVSQFDTKIIIFLDALDRYMDRDLFYENIFHVFLPSNVKFIISATTDIENEIIGLQNQYMELGKMNSTESIKILRNLLRTKGRRLCKKHEIIVMKAMQSGCLPIQIKLLSEICESLYSFEKLEILDMNPSILVLQLLENMMRVEGHGENFVRMAMAFLAVAPDGLTQRELCELLMEVPKIREECLQREEQKAELVDEKYLPVVYWSRLSYDMGECVHTVFSHGYQVIKFEHLIFQSTFENYLEEITYAKKALIRFFEKMENYGCNEKVNLRKVFSLLPLQEIEGGVAETLTNPELIQCLIESGQLHYVMGLWSQKREEIADQRVFSTLLNWNTALECYKTSFLTYYAIDHRQRQEKTMLYLDATVFSFEEDFIPYPFSREDNAMFSKDGKYYAILKENILYIWSRQLRREIKRFVINETLNSSNKYCCVWGEFDDLMVVTSDLRCFVYEINEEYARFSDEIDFSDIVYLPSEKEQILKIKMSFPLNEDKFVIQYYTKQGQSWLYLPTAEEEFPYIISFMGNQSTILWDEKGSFSILGNPYFLQQKYPYPGMEASDEWKMESCRRRKIRCRRGCEFEDAYKVKDQILLTFSRNTWTENGLITAFAFVGEKERIEYVCPPNIQNLYQILVGREVILLVYRDEILRMNIEKRVVDGVYKSNNFYTACWVIKDEKIALFSEQKMTIFDLNKMQNCEISIFITRDKSILKREKEENYWLKKVVSARQSFNFMEMNYELKDLWNLCLYSHKQLKLLKNLEKNGIEFIEDNEEALAQWKYLQNKEEEERIKLRREFELEKRKKEQKRKNIEYLDMLDDSEQYLSFDKVTMAAIANDGKYAIAYEKENLILIRDVNKKLEWKITGIHFSVDQTLLRILFSPLSDYLLLECSQRLILIDIVEDKKIWELSLKRRVARKIVFQCGQNEMQRLEVFCNGKIWEIEMQKGRCVVKCFTQIKESEEELIREKNIRKAFQEERYYFSNKRNNTAYIVISRGFQMQYYGEKDIIFEMDNINLALLEETLFHQRNKLENYWREKNDRNGCFYECGDFLVLVSPAFQSVFLLNIKLEKIEAVYYHPYGIEGHAYKGDNRVWIIDYNGELYQISLELQYRIQNNALLSSKRQARTLLQRHKKLIVNVAIVVGIAMGMYQYINRPVHEKIEKEPSLIETKTVLHMEKKKDTVRDADSDFAYDLYDYNMEKICGILFQGTDDYDKDGKEEELIIRLEDGEDSINKIITATMYERVSENTRRYLDKCELSSSFYFEYMGGNTLADIFCMQDGERTLLGLSKIHGIANDHNFLEIIIWEFKNKKFTQLVSIDDMSQIGSTHYNMSHLLDEFDIEYDANFLFDGNSIIDTSEKMVQLCSIRKEEIIPVGNLSDIRQFLFLEDETRKAPQTLDYAILTIQKERMKNSEGIAKQQSYTFSPFVVRNFKSGMSFKVTDFFKEENILEGSIYGIEDGSGIYAYEQLANGQLDMMLERKSSNIEDKKRELKQIYLDELKELSKKPMYCEMREENFIIKCLNERGSNDQAMKCLNGWIQNGELYVLELTDYPIEYDARIDKFLTALHESFFDSKSGFEGQLSENEIEKEYENNSKVKENLSKEFTEDVDFVHGITLNYPDSWKAEVSSNYGWFGTNSSLDGTVEAGFCAGTFNLEKTVSENLQNDIDGLENIYEVQSTKVLSDGYEILWRYKYDNETLYYKRVWSEHPDIAFMACGYVLDDIKEIVESVQFLPEF